MNKKNSKNYRFCYDELTQKYSYLQETPFYIREFLDNNVFNSLFTLRSFHVLQMNTDSFQMRIVKHITDSIYDCYVTSFPTINLF